MHFECVCLKRSRYYEIPGDLKILSHRGTFSVKIHEFKAIALKNLNKERQRDEPSTKQNEAKRAADEAEREWLENYFERQLNST